MNNKRIPQALFNADIEFNVYQYDPFLEFFDWNENEEKWKPKGKNLLIKDEVGVGKTIETGIIIKEFLKYKKNAKILIVVPVSYLCSQWRNELSKLFFIDFYDYKHQKCDNFKDYPLKICTKNDLNDFKNDKFNLLILDEVHSYRNQNNGYDDLDELIEKSERIIAMSATLKVNSDEDTETIKGLIKKNEELEIAETANKKHEVFCLNSFPIIEDIMVDITEEEYQIHNEILEIIEGNVIYKQMLVSSLPNIKTMFNGEELKEVEEQIGVEEHECKEKINQWKKENIEKDSKFEKLHEKFGELSKDPKYGHGYIIFSYFLDTCSYLNQELNKLNEKKYKVYNIGQRGLTKENINYLLSEFKTEVEKLKEKKSEKRAILIASDRISEGINLQFCNVLVNYDFGFTAAKLYQRNGRIDRKGQKNTPYIFNMFLKYGDKIFYDTKIIEDFVENKNKENGEFIYNVTSKTSKAFRDKIKEELKGYENIDSEDAKKAITDIFQKKYDEKLADFCKEVKIMKEDIYSKHIENKILNNDKVKYDEKSKAYVLDLKEEKFKEKLYKIFLDKSKLAYNLQFLFCDYEKFVKGRGFFYSYEEIKEKAKFGYNKILKDEVKFRFHFFETNGNDKESIAKEEIGFLPLNALTYILGE